MSSKGKRLSSKEYDDLLKIMRRWPEPYLGIMAKIIWHLIWQTDEIKRLDASLKKLQQSAFDDPPAVKPKAPTPDYTPHVKDTAKWPLSKRLKHIADTEGRDSDSWKQSLKWNALREEDATKLIDSYIEDKLATKEQEEGSNT